MRLIPAAILSLPINATATGVPAPTVIPSIVPAKANVNTPLATCTPLYGRWLGQLVSCY
ncbi:hypothetical protein PT276_04285 [Orbaceae bacterium ESL0721]|nr:hypothetical protein [Orbaceae bacterium ESL0721]